MLLSNLQNLKNKDILLEEFDANYEGEHKNNFNILLTTEVLNEVDWKMHKKMNLPTDARDRLLEESIDVMKFLLGLMIVNGFTVDDVYNMFKIKSKKVAKKLSQE